MMIDVVHNAYRELLVLVVYKYRTSNLTGLLSHLSSSIPFLVLFKDGKPVMRMYEESFYLDIVAKVGKYCDDA